MEKLSRRVVAFSLCDKGATISVNMYRMGREIRIVNIFLLVGLAGNVEGHFVPNTLFTFYTKPIHFALYLDDFVNDDGWELGQMSTTGRNSLNFWNAGC